MPFQFVAYFKSMYGALFLPAPWTGSRVVTYLFFLMVYPSAMLFNAITLMMDHLFFPGFKQVKVENPVFIVGNARSGTTYMHRLLALDTEYFNSFKLSDLVLISVGAKKFFQWLGRVDRNHLGGALQKWLDGFQAMLLKEADKVHKLRLSHPEEDEGVLIHCWASAFCSLVYPLPHMVQFERFDEMPEPKRRKLMAHYKGCVQRQLYCNGGQHIHLLSKNPLFSSKLNSIFETFPDARIIYMARTPYETVASLHNMVDRIWNVQLQLDKSAQPREGLTQMCIYAYKYALQCLDAKPQDRSIIVKYEDLVHSPYAVVEQIYSRFNLPISPKYAEELKRVTEKNKGYKSEHSYSLEAFGLSKERVYRETKEVFDRFGFDPQGEFASGPKLAGDDVRVA